MRGPAAAAGGLLALAVVTRARTARAESLSPSDARALSAFAAGAAAAAIPLAVGGDRISLGHCTPGRITNACASEDLARKNSGWVVAASGLTLAPIAAHVAVRDYGKAALFGVLPAASTAGIGALVAVNPKAIFDGDTGSRTVFATLFTTCAASSVLGVIDAMHPFWGTSPGEHPVAITIGPGRVGLEGTW